MGTKHTGSRAEVRALDAFIKLLRATATVSGQAHEHLRQARLTASQFGVLEALFHLGPLSQSELGHKILRSSGDMTTVIDNLERRRLVRRARSREDRRQSIVSLTAAGSRLIREIFPRHAAQIVDALSPLSAAEQRQLAALCRKLGLGGSRPPARRPRGASSAGGR